MLTWLYQARIYLIGPRRAAERNDYKLYFKMPLMGLENWRPGGWKKEAVRDEARVVFFLFSRRMMDYGFPLSEFYFGVEKVSLCSGLT